MKIILKRSLTASLIITLGLMVAPLGAAAQSDSATLSDTATAGTEAAKADVQVQEQVAEAAAKHDDSKATALAEARKAKTRATRGQQAKNRREWLKFAFGRNEHTGFDKEFFLGPATRAEFAESSRQWFDFAFGTVE